MKLIHSLFIHVFIGLLFLTAPIYAAEERGADKPVYVFLMDTSGSTTGVYSDRPLYVFKSAISRILQDEAILLKLQRCPATLSFITWNNTAREIARVESDSPEGVTHFWQQVQKGTPFIGTGDTVPANALRKVHELYPDRFVNVLMFLDPAFASGKPLEEAVRQIRESNDLIVVLQYRSGQDTDVISPYEPLSLQSSNLYLPPIRELFFGNCLVNAM